ncbi:MAG: NACHT domain-containing protein [Trebonia sp.]
MDVLTRVPTGRLVVLGDPGGGKTMLTVRLVLDLLAHRTSGGPVPILAPVASWDPSNQGLRDWLVDWLTIDYPALAGPAPIGRAEPSQAEALLASGLILLILDGLDEIPEHVRGPAISRINNAIRPGERLVVTCRSREYQDAIRPEVGVEVTLRAAAAVQLRPLNADTVRDYLVEDAAGPVAKARWKPVMKLLGTEAPAAQALSTPLMVGLARAIYNPRPGEISGTLRDPAELCSPDLTDRTMVESMLFDAFILAAYRHDSKGPGKAQEAERWLTFLASHLQYTIGEPRLAWWQLRRAIPRVIFRLAVALAFVILYGLALALQLGMAKTAGHGFVAGFKYGLVLGLALALTGTFFVSLLSHKEQDQVPSRGVRISANGLGYGLMMGGLSGFAGAVVAVFQSGLASGLGLVLGISMTVGYMTWVGGGIAAKSGDLTVAASPRTVLTHDEQAALSLMLLGGLGSGLAAGLVAGLELGLAAGLEYGLAIGLLVGLFLAGNRTAWPSFMFTRGWLSFHRRLPWSLMPFLADAHQRGILRQSGAVYQFRHIELQHRLASRDVGESRASSPAKPPSPAA